MIGLGSLPIITLLLIILLYARKGCDWTDSILLGSIVWLFAISLLTEAVSFENAIGFPSLAWAWGVSIFVLIILHVTYPGPAKLKRARIRLADYSATELISLLLMGTIFTTTLFVAVISPPNNADSQTYHLPRIEHWIQDRSLTPYPTAIERQIADPGFAETVVLQLRVLSGGDRLDNLVQWLAALGSIVAVGRIAAHLGASRQGSIIASVFAASLPMMILESTNTKNDVLLSFLLLCAVERLLAWSETRSLRDAAYMAMAAGLALATKGTAYPIGAPLGVYFLVALARQPKGAIWCGLVCLPLLLLPNLGFFARNIAFLGSPFGSIGVGTNNAEFGPGPLALNAIRDIALNLASFHGTLNNWITSAAVHLIQGLGLDPNDPATTFPESTFGLNTWGWNHEDKAANPIHFVLAAIAVVASIRSTSPPAQRRYGFTVLAAAVLFMIVIRWSPWITRLQLPLFALAAPLVSCLSILQKRERFAIALLAALALSALPALLMNKTRSLVSLPGHGLLLPEGVSAVQSLLSQTSLQLRFANRPYLLLPYEKVTRYVTANDHHDIGLLMGGDDWEYPLWQLLQQAEVKPLRVEHVFNAPNSRQPDYPLGPFRPTLIIATVPDRPSVLVIDGVNWNRRVELPALSLYTPAR